MNFTLTASIIFFKKCLLDLLKSLINSNNFPFSPKKHSRNYPCILPL